jgi:acyl carrier protein
MQLVVAAEESFQTILTPADLTRENLSTPNSLANLITNKTPKT